MIELSFSNFVLIGQSGMGFMAWLVALAGAAIALAPGLFGLILAGRERRLLDATFSRGPFDRSTIDQATRWFVPSRCSVTDPRGETLRPNGRGSAREDLFHQVDRFITGEDPVRRMMILGDAGMGKTTFVLNYYAYHMRQRRGMNFAVAVVPMGHPDADGLIRDIPAREHTVVFLDAFDADIAALDDPAARLEGLMESCRGFRRVILTCRPRFFEKTGALKPGEDGMRRFWTLTLLPFENGEAARLLTRRFPLWQWSARRRAVRAAHNNPVLAGRPLLLAFMPERQADAADHPLGLSRWYGAMVDAWLKRESHWVDPDLLGRFAERFALDIFTHRRERGMERIPYPEMCGLAREWCQELEHWKLGRDSFLNRDASGNFKFIHRSVMEYFFVKAFLALPFAERPILHWTEQMKDFLVDMITCRTAPLDISRSDLSGTDLRALDLDGLDLRETNLEGARLPRQ